MKRNLTIFLQVLVVLIGICVIAFMLWEPHVEGRNVNATLFQIYFEDPFLAYAYIGSIPFFMVLYQAFALLGYIGENRTVSPDSLKALRTIKYCAMTLIAFILGAEAYFFIVQRGKDDIAGGVMLGLAMIVLSVVTATAASVSEKRLRREGGGQ